MRDDQDPLANVKPYDGPISPFALDEIFIEDAFARDDERLWMPVTPYSWSRPLCLCASQGYWVHLSKYRGREPCSYFIGPVYLTVNIDLTDDPTLQAH